MIREKQNGIKIATTIIFEEIKAGSGEQFILGMIHFAKRFGAITAEDQSALIQYLKERG